MKKLLFSAVIIAFGIQSGYSQDGRMHSQRMITLPEKGTSVEVRQELNAPGQTPRSLYAPLCTGDQLGGN